MKKQVFVYPGSDLDRGRNLVALLGTFWSTTYTGKDQVRSYAETTAQSVAQSFQNLMEAVAALSRVDVPLFHIENWLPIVIRKSQRNQSSASLVRFDRNAAAFDDKTKQFDVPAVDAFFEYPAPLKLVSIASIFNRLVFPTIALADKIDFFVDDARGALVFVNDPFESPEFLRRGIYDKGKLVDEEITLWAFKGAFDYEYVFTQFAYALGVRMKTSQGFKELTNAIFDGLVDGGASAQALDLAVSAICGIPLTLDDQEIVEVMRRDARGMFIATDKNVYRFQEDAAPVVAVGDVLRAGSRLVDAFSVEELLHGEVSSNISALALDGGYLSACFYGDLIFENKAVPLEVDTEHPSGYTFVKFGVGGFPLDVQKFFDEIHARGIALVEAENDTCFDNPVRYPTRLELPSPGRVEPIYRADDTGKFYRWTILAPAKPEVGEYVELAEKEPCGPPWQQFPSRSNFPAIGTATQFYLAADTGKFYRWATRSPALPPSGEYVEVFKPRGPRHKIGTLAHILDKRAKPEGEPTANNLPKTINPLQFIVQNVLRNNVFLIKIRVNELGQNRPGLYNIRHLRQLVPPQSAMIVIFDLKPPVSAINADDNLTENVTQFTAAEPLSDAVYDSLIRDVGVVLRTISGTCQ